MSFIRSAGLVDLVGVAAVTAAATAVRFISFYFLIYCLYLIFNIAYIDCSSIYISLSIIKILSDTAKFGENNAMLKKIC